MPTELRDVLVAQLKADAGFRLKFLNARFEATGQKTLPHLKALAHYEAALQASIDAKAKEIEAARTDSANGEEDDEGTVTAWCEACCHVNNDPWLCTIFCNWLGLGCSCCPDPPEG
jgi:hypothetical protein